MYVVVFPKVYLRTKLFIIYMNDIFNVSKAFKLILFADDTNLFYYHSNLNEGQTQSWICCCKYIVTKGYKNKLHDGLFTKSQIEYNRLHEEQQRST